MVQTRSASKAESNSLNGIELKLLKTIYIGETERIGANTEEEKAVTEEPGKATSEYAAGCEKEQPQFIAKPRDSCDVAESQAVNSLETMDKKNTEGSTENDDILVVWSSVREPNDRSETNTADNEKIQHGEDQSVQSAEDTLSLKCQRSAVASSKKKFCQSKRPDTLATPTRRSRRLASEEPETFSKESLPIDLGGTRHYSRVGSEEVTEEEDRCGKAGDFENTSVRIGIPAVEAIVEEGNESESKSLHQINEAEEMDEDNSKQMIDEKNYKLHVSSVANKKSEVLGSASTQVSDDANVKNSSSSIGVDEELETADHPTPSDWSSKGTENVEGASNCESIVEAGTNSSSKMDDKKEIQDEANIQVNSSMVLVACGQNIDTHDVVIEQSTTHIENEDEDQHGQSSMDFNRKSCVAVKADCKEKASKESSTSFSFGCFPKWDKASLIQRRRSDPACSVMDDCIKNAYALLFSDVSGKENRSGSSLLLLNDEVIWQQLNEHNRRLKKVFQKMKYLFEHGSLSVGSGGSVLMQTDETNSDARFNPDGNKDKERSDGNSEDGFPDEGAPHWNDSNTEDFKDLDTKLMQLDEGDDFSQGDETSEDEKPVRKSYPKSAVDDRFFSFAEMEAYLDEQDSKGNDDVGPSVFEQVPDSDEIDGGADYHYAEFYGESDYETELVANDIFEKKKKKRKKTSDELNEVMSSKKKVRFEIDENGEDKPMDNGKRTDSVERVLLGAFDGDEITSETPFQKRQKKLKAKIAALEEENLAPRSWELSGEVTAISREENSLLEKDVDYDYTRKITPVITLDKTQNLESIIIQRIKDKAFDDVMRKVREPDTARGYRPPVKEEMTKKPLTEVYEEEYQRAQNAETVEKKDERKVEIERRIKDLFFKIDALFHYNTNPPEVRPEVSIVSNMASLRKEEVGPLASTEEMLVAPEEVQRHERGEVKGKDERTSTDRARERRKKKKLQKLLDREKRRKLVSEKNTGNEIQDANKTSNKAVKSSTFFKQLQETTVKEVKAKSKKTTGKERREGSKKINACAKYML